jgi:ribonucleoside-diphosphate reductase alpha chain
MNPNNHAGIIYSSNLCTEIMQNMSPIVQQEARVVKDENGDSIVIETSKAGDFVVCNLASLVLGNIVVDNDDELADIIKITVRALDNVITMNDYPVKYAEITNNEYRAIGLGVSGYHHMLCKKMISWDTEEHITFVDKLFERIAYHTINASRKLAMEKGAYSKFVGSDWETGDYFDKRGYDSEEWLELKEAVSENGMRNSYLMAVAPTGSTSIIAGTTATIDPIHHRYYMEEKKGSIVPRVAPDLNEANFWLYKSAHLVSQSQSIKACGVRQRHIDQAQSFNLYITPEYTMRGILDLLIQAHADGLKTVYYVRSRSLEVAECDSCSA